MADRHGSRTPKREYKPTFEDKAEDKLYPGPRIHTTRQQDKVPSPRSQPEPAAVSYHHDVPDQNAVPGMGGPIEADDGQPEKIVSIGLQIQPPQNGPTSATGKTIRFSGIFLVTIGTLYADADVYVHRMGDPKERDFKAKGGVLSHMRSAIDTQATYRVTITKGDVGNERAIGWNDVIMAGHGYSADEYCNVLELGESHFGQIVMCTVHKNNIRAWRIIRQIPGKIYTFQDCFDLLVLPGWCRQELSGFGAKTWVNGDIVPELWLCKDLSVKNVANKIRNVMRQ